MHIIFGRFLRELWPLIDVRILLTLSILWINLWILIKFCFCIDIDKMYIWMIMSPTEGEGDILFLVRILSALVLASASVWHFLFAWYLMNLWVDFK